MKVRLADVAENIFAGGDVPKDRFSETVTDKFKIPVYANAEKDNGLYGYTDIARVSVPCITVAARGTIGFTAKRTEAFLPVVRLITVIPDKEKITLDYLYYALRNCRPKYTGTSIPQLTVPDIKNYSFEIMSISKQEEITQILGGVELLEEIQKKQIDSYDKLIKSRFVEMFGDPIYNTKGLLTVPIGEVFYLKAGITTRADEIHDKSVEYPIPCYGGNGIRGYVKEATQCGDYPIIGRQGALCGNVQLASGEFYATEHAVLVTPLIESNVVWIYYLLKFMNLHRYHTGAAQPGLAVKTLNAVRIPIAEIALQNQFSAFVQQVEKLKTIKQKSLDETQLLFDSLMNKYFE